MIGLLPIMLDVNAIHNKFQSSIVILRNAKNMIKNFTAIFVSLMEISISMEELLLKISLK